ncbi:MAG: serine/threonine protein kinase, partial [Chitinispirillaceae bacterium]|nr:serine/threonine protein kinase [Chitinispirillaceae bacterium]
MEPKKNFLNIYTSPTNQKSSGETNVLGSGYITGILGEGGAAVVYEIWNPQLELHRAVKLWRPNFSARDLQRFETEIKITSKLDHPNIVEIHTVGDWNGLPYIEMEKIDGFSLQQLLKTHGVLPPAVALAIIQFVCRALIYAHQQEISIYGRKRKGVIHCDIKPANIMITRNGVVKLMDFGIANPANVSLNSDPHKITGSLQYMAPEQIRSQNVDARTDIYSVGVVLYEMLSGTKAFPSKQLLEIIEKRKTNEFVPLEHFCFGLPKKLYKIVEKCMSVAPEERYQSAAELMKDISSVYRKLTKEEPQVVLQQYIENGGIIVSKPSKRPKESIHIPHSLFYTVVGAVLAFLLFVSLFTIVAKLYKSGERDTQKISTVSENEHITKSQLLESNNRETNLSLVTKPENKSLPTNTKQLTDVKEERNLVGEEKVSELKEDPI